MKRTLLIVLIFGIVTGLAVLLLDRKDEDITQIQQNLNHIVSLVEKKDRETLITSFSRMQKLASFFSEDCRVEVGNPVSEIKSKDELITTASQLRQLVNNIEVKLSDVSIFLESPNKAKSTFVAVAVGSSSLMERNEVDPRMLEVTWKKIGRDWKITRVQVIDILH